MMTDKVLAYCEAIHTQDPKAFEALWSRKSDCTLISIGTVFRGYTSIYEDFLINGIRANYESIRLIPDDIAVATVVLFAA